MSVLILAETTRTPWRGDGTLPGIMARLDDGAGRILGFWASPEGWTADRFVHAYVKGRNGQTSYAVRMTPDEARRLARSLDAMADHAEHGPNVAPDPLDAL